MVKKKNQILNDFYTRSEKIKNQCFVEHNYEEFAIKSITYYLNSIYRDNILIRILNKIFGNCLDKKINDRKRTMLINYFECESHRELIVEGLKKNKLKF